MKGLNEKTKHLKTRVGMFLGWNIAGGNFLGGYFPGGNFQGESFPDTTKTKSYIIIQTPKNYSIRISYVN